MALETTPASQDDDKCRPTTGTGSGRLSALTTRQVEAVGPWFFRHWQLTLNGTNNLHIQGASEGDSEEKTDSTVHEVDIEFLRSLDPKEWKEQDHYAVLGLKTIRYKASDDDIKKAYRRMVLRHHPDKRKGAGEEVRQDEDYFSCITKAYEILGNSFKRRSYDSVDPEFNDDIPPISELSKANFFEVYSPVFKRNSRWSGNAPVPLLGNLESTREEVERFYSFWYNFNSWREFSYLDEEEKDKGQDRESRRWIEKQNKAERMKRKKEEMTRIRLLVDNAYSCDPRVQKFQDEDKEKKNALKKAKQDAARAKQEEEERIKREALENERMARLKAESEEKAARDAERKEKEILTKALKREKKKIRALCKDNDYFANDDAEKLSHMESSERMCEGLRLQELEELSKNLEEAVPQSKGKDVFLKWCQIIDSRIEKEREELMKQADRRSSSKGKLGGNQPWADEDLQLLIKAVNLFPAGTNQRWEVVANFINQHSNGVKRNAKEVLAKAKDLQGSDYSKSYLKAAANQRAFDNFEKVQKGATVVIEANASERFESLAEQLGMNRTPWSTTEQQLLEQALKTFPSSTADRWDRIAECLPNRSKKDCMKRYKELAEMIRAKKNAQAGTVTKSK